MLSRFSLYQTLNVFLSFHGSSGFLPVWVRVNLLREGRQGKRKLIHEEHQMGEDKMEEAMDKEWRPLSEEMLSGVKEWRLAHPKAPLREIEQEASERVSRLQARMVQDGAGASPTADCRSLPQEERPTCPNCAKALIPPGKRKRRLQGGGGREGELSRSSGTCPSCGMGLVPALMRNEP
jgi:RNase P subunit RPR2